MSLQSSEDSIWCGTKRKFFHLQQFGPREVVILSEIKQKNLIQNVGYQSSNLCEETKQG